MASRSRSAAKRPLPRDRLPNVLHPAPDPDFRQDRSRRSYQALIDAATELFGTHSYDTVGTPEIAERAGVSVGTFYRYFDDKHEIYLEITRRTMIAGYHETIANLEPAQLTDLTRRETISHTIALLFEYIMSRPQLTRSFQEMALRDTKVAELVRAFEQSAVNRIAQLIAASVPRDIAPDPEATAWIVHAAATQTAYALAGHHGPSPIGAERARKALADFLERALFRSRL